MRRFVRFVNLVAACAFLFGAAVFAAEEPDPDPGNGGPPAGTEPEEFTDDLIVLRNDLAIEGKVLSQTEDHREALSAFLEKREPVFKGR